MLFLSKGLCQKTGLDQLPTESKMYLELELSTRYERRMAVRVKDELSPREHREFEALFEQGDPASAFRFLKQLLPQYERLTREENERIEDDIARDAEAILAIEDALGHLRSTCGQKMSALDGCSGMEPPLAT